MAIYLIDSDAVFLHNQKCAGTWIIEAIKAAGIRYKELSASKHAHKGLVKETKDKFTFTSIRHPLSWYRSYWAYKIDWINFEKTVSEEMKKPQFGPWNRIQEDGSWKPWHYGKIDGSEGKWHPTQDIDRYCGKGDKASAEAFNEFIKKCADKFPGFLSDIYELYAGNEENPIDYVIKTETVHFDLIRVLEMLGEKFDKSIILNFPHQNHFVTDTKKHAVYTRNNFNLLMKTEQKAVARWYKNFKVPEEWIMQKDKT